MLHKLLERLAREYTYERAKPFAGSDFGNFVRHDIALEAKRTIMYWPFDLTVKSSVGAGNWAAVPWLAFFDPVETTSATSGVYVVYLINPQTEEIYLSLNQGTTAVHNEFGTTRGQEVLRRRAVDIADRVADFAKYFEDTPIELGSSDRLPSGYMAGHSFGRKYRSGEIAPERFYEDLQRMLSAYSALVDRGGLTPVDIMHEDSGTPDIQETRRYVLSKRIERAPNVRPKVLEKRGCVCEGCGLDPAIHLLFAGAKVNVPLDVHHSRPIHHLAEGESRRYKIPDDFLVLCPTCHRLIHQQDNPSDLETLKSRINFEFRPLK